MRLVDQGKGDPNYQEIQSTSYIARGAFYILTNICPESIYLQSFPHASGGNPVFLDK